MGSGNFLIYAFDLLYDLYKDQIENYGADYDEEEIPRLIIEKNGETLRSDLEKIVIDLWSDLQQAHRFGSLLRLQEKYDAELQNLINKNSGKLFEDEYFTKYNDFRQNFFTNLQKAIEHNKAKEGLNFLNTKTADAITFLRLLTQKYDVAVANPPYTDSSDFGPELKKFIEDNYKKPNKFHSNLYAAFIKRNIELTDENGFVGMIHPHTFMFIKTFEDVRKYMISQTHIDLMVDYGLDRVNLFGPGILLDATWYVLSKKMKDVSGVYFQITGGQQEKTKKASLEIAYEDFIASRPNPRVYTLPQEKLKIIDGWPFIYWISDSFREKFKTGMLKKYFIITRGFNPGRNEKYLRSINEISSKSYIKMSKGGPFIKWYGSVWMCIDYQNKIKEIEKEKFSSFSGSEYYNKNGVFTPRVGTKGPSFKIKEAENLISDADIGIFPIDGKDIFYLIAFLNSIVNSYVLRAFNPTVNTTVSDLERIPFVQPPKDIETKVSSLAKENISIKKHLCEYSIIEMNFQQTPLTAFEGNTLQERLLNYLNYENFKLTKVLVNEAIIDELIYKVYELNEADRAQVEAKMGKAVGSLPVLKEALEEFKSNIEAEASETKDLVLAHLNSLPIADFEEDKIRQIKKDFETIYQSNNDLEEFCKTHQVNPINVWYWFKEARILPKARAKDIALEFLADTIRTLLMQDEDGIIPLVSLPGEDALAQRLEHYCMSNGFTSAQFLQLDQLLGHPLNDYLENHFFKDLSDHLNLFMYLPKTPFIWHLSSGKYQGIELYTIIYKWKRDSLYKIKSQYIHDRKNSLEYRLLQLQDVNTAQAQSEKEKIHLQLQEIEKFAQKIDELIAEGYNPKLDDGVGKNIAPLQAKGLLRAEVLKSGGQNSELQKYLNADW